MVASKKKAGTLRRHGALYAMLLPGVALFLIFSYAPMWYLITAFQDFVMRRGILGSEFVGLKHFSELVNDRIFPTVVRNTVCINLLKTLFGFPVPIVLALAFSEMRDSIAKRAMQTFIYLPHFFSWVVAYGLIIGLFSVSTGYFSELLTSWGLRPFNFLGVKKYYWPFLIISEQWKEAGWGSIIYIAALAGVNPELYEAAKVDGATKLRQIMHISLPSIRPTIFVLLILGMGSLVSGSFEQVLATTNNALFEVSEILPLFVYHEGIVDMNYSYATAAGLLQSIISFGLVATTNYLSRKLDGVDLW